MVFYFLNRAIFLKSFCEISRYYIYLGLSILYNFIIIEAEGSRAPIGFHRLFFANPSSDALKIPTGIPCGIFLVLTKNSSVKTASHLSARGFVEIFGAEDAALLTQGKDNKAKRSQNIC